jgi:kynurenine formamidase
VPAPPLPDGGIIVDLGAPVELDDSPPAAGDPAAAGRLVVTLARGAPLFEVSIAGRDGSMIGDVAPARCIARGVVLDISARVSKDLGAKLEVDDIEAFEALHGRIRADEFVLLRTGYDVHAPLLRDPAQAYSAPIRAPGFSLAAMQFLVEDRGVRRIATDAPFLAAAPATDRAVDSALYRRGGFAVTRLVGLERLPPRGATIVALPLAAAQRSAAPARVVAIVPR